MPSDQFFWLIDYFYLDLRRHYLAMFYVFIKILFEIKMFICVQRFKL